MNSQIDPTQRRIPRGIESPRTMNMLIRQQVSSFWRGPHSIDAILDTTEQFWGWQVLALDARIYHGLDPECESRSVYGIIHNDAEPHAILRAVYWNQSDERQAMNTNGLNYSFGMPARFVQIPAAQLRTWVKQFEGHAIPINPTWAVDRSEPVRRLRIESDYVSSIVENTWEAGQLSHTGLDVQWASVWAEMTEILRAAPIVTQVAENYQTVIGIPRYNLDAYRPDAFGRSSSEATA
jgi:hypothetical protein